MAWCLVKAWKLYVVQNNYGTTFPLMVSNLINYVHDSTDSLF